MKGIAVFPELEIDHDHDDSDKKVQSIEGLYEENECMWLSSGSKSTSLLSSDDLESLDAGNIGLWDVFLSDRFSSMLSVSGSSQIFWDSSKYISSFAGINPIVEAYLLSDNTWEGLDKDLQVEELGTRLNQVDASMRFSDINEYTYERSLFEDSLVIDGSWTPLSAQDEPSPLRSLDFDRTDVWVSLLDLEGEDSEWEGDRVRGFDVLDSDFPSPSYNAKSQSGSLGSTFNLPSEHVLEINTLSEDSDSDEPLFWPFDRNLYCSPEFKGNYLCISPRENGGWHGISERLTGSKSLRFSLHQQENLSLYQQNAKEKNSGRILLGSRSTPLNMVDCKAKDRKSHVPRMVKVPSRFRRSSPSCTDQIPCTISIPKREKQLKDINHKVDGKKDLLTRPLALEEGDFQNFLVDKVPIETMVGLKEFDGHEGLKEEDQEWLPQDILLC